MDKTQFILGPDSILESSLILAYLDTNYGVAVSGVGESPVGTFNLNVGAVSEDLIGLHKRHGVDCSAYVTPCNPLGESLGDSENESRLTGLRAELRKRSLRFLEGVGVNPDGKWPGEHSFLILGLSLESAKVLAIEQSQNAFVWASTDGIPKLVLLR